MADAKVPTLEDLARAEALQIADREKKKLLYVEQQARLLTEMPARFFVLARQIRDGVGRFNGAAKLPRQLVYTETTAVTMRDTNPAADFVVEVHREPNSALVALRQMRRLHLPDAFVIEGEGTVGVEPERFKLRIDAQFRAADLHWRIMSEGKEVDTSIDEVADRLVAVVATGELSRLWTRAPFVDRPGSPAKS